VVSLDVVADSLRSVQPATGDFNCHRRRIESNFTRETFRQCIGQILLDGKYEGTDFEELALDIGFHPVDQTHAGKLAREVGLSTTGDNGLVPNQQKPRNDGLGLWEAFSNARYGNPLGQPPDGKIDKRLLTKSFM
jgi:hypothetical protein